MLKKPFYGLFQLGKTKIRFCLSSIFDDLQALKRAALPGTAVRQPKSGVFQQPASPFPNPLIKRRFGALVFGIQ
jgi:hypothetical protein